SSAQFSIYVSIANNLLTAVYRPQNPFSSTELPFPSAELTFLSAELPSSSARLAIFPFLYLHLQNEEHLPVDIFPPPDNNLKMKRKNSFRSINPLPPRHSQ